MWSAAEWRASEFTQPELIKIGALVLDLAAHEARLGGTKLALANREFDLLVHLVRGRGRVQRREQILAAVWRVRGREYSRSLDVHIRKLRAKLAGAISIETVRGVGYRIDSPTA